MKRRLWLAAGCAHCVGLFSGMARADADLRPSLPAVEPNWATPKRFDRPEVSTDEGGLWAMMDREETRLRRSPFLMRDEGLREYLQGIACKLGAAHCADIRVYPIRTPYFNASMAPNGMMQVWSGLLLRVDNEAQLAAVLGHEIGHYMQRHTLDRLRDIKARAAFGTFMAMFGLVGAIGQLAALAGAFGFSRDQERQADLIGLKLMQQAGYEPRAAAAVWDQLRAELTASAGGDPTQRNPLFASHPPSDERSATLTRLAANAPAGHGGDAEYAAKLAPFQFDLLEDELRRGQFDETLILLDRKVAAVPTRADLLYFRAETRRLRAKAGDTEPALADLARAVEMGGEPAQTHRCLGYIEQRRSQWGAARSAFTRYLEHAPTAPDAALIQGYLTQMPA